MSIFVIIDHVKLTNNAFLVPVNKGFFIFFILLLLYYYYYLILFLFYFLNHSDFSNTYLTVDKMC